MCGIFATTADKNAAKTILDGLKRLEYRGYDSWGIAVKSDRSLLVDKHTGKISQSHTSLPKSLIGIGHTRWATHGGVTKNNSHPHLDCTHKLALVHNGIVDNWQELKDKLKGHKIISETDTEIIVHLIEQELKTNDLFDATYKVFKKLHGLNAILVMHQDYPYLVTAKSGSPIILGLNPENNLVSSDVASLLPFTNKVVFLEDNQIAKVSSNQIVIKDINTSKNIKPKIVTIDWKQDSSSKGTFSHFMLKEIYEEPKIISQIAKDHEKVIPLAKAIKKAKGTFTVACGSAAYAAHVGQYLFFKISQTHINPAIGSEFYYHANFLNKDSLCVSLSQSGETIDTIQSIQFAKKRHAHTFSILNIKGSTLDRLSDQSIYLDVGPEKAVASTKAFIAKIALLHLTAHTLAKSTSLGVKELNQASVASKKILHENTQVKIKDLAQRFKKSSSIFILGKGQSYPAALEIALKIKEISYIHAEGFPSGELKHGVIALVTKLTPVIVLAPQDETYSDVISGAMEVKARGGTIIGFSSAPNPVFDYYFEIPDCGNATVIPHIILGQTLAYQLALSKKLDPDMPRNLAKSVTVK